MRNKLQVKTTPGFWYLLAVLFLVLPLQWVWAILFSSLIHESSHLIAAKGMGVPAQGLHLGADGAYLETNAMTPVQELVCALAGPIGALLIIMFARWLPRTAVCTVVQSCFHLLPIYPLDGGRALRSLTQFAGLPKGNALCFGAELLTVILLAATGLYLSVWKSLGVVPLVVAFTMIFRTCREKYLANRDGKGYNIHTN